MNVAVYVDYLEHRFHMSVRPSRAGRNAVLLTPASGLEALDADGQRWRATDHDPRFAFDALRRFAGRWVELSVVLETDERTSGNAAVILDTGLGPLEELIVKLPRPSPDENRSTVVFPVPPDLQDAWFAPCSGPVAFRLESVRIEPLSRWRAIIRIGWILRGTKHLEALLAVYMPQWRSMRELATRRQLKGAVMAAYRSVLRDRHSSYVEWIAQFEMQPKDYPRLASQRERWSRLPLVSIVMPTWETPAKFLREAIESVLQQTYSNWQLCIADDGSTTPHVRAILEEFVARDPRIRVVYRTTNGHICAASNAALELATGEFVALLDHDDRLHPLALHYVAEMIVEQPDAQLIFSDEDKIDSTGARFAPNFKCDFNHELFLAQNAINHLGCYRLETVRRLEGFRIGYEGSQDWDLALRMLEFAGPDRIFHIPRVLYHWRESPGSTAVASDQKPYAAVAGRRAVVDYLQRQGIDATVTPLPAAPDWNRIRYALPGRPPRVSIVIPTRDQIGVLRTCVDSLVGKTAYPDFEVIVVDNGSIEPETLAYLSSQEDSRVRVIRDDSPFNYSRLNNRAVQSSSGTLVCLMNNDIEVIDADWLDEMVALSSLPATGIVGARLWYPDFTIQHAGVILGIGGIAGHAHRLLPRGDAGYFGRAIVPQQFSAVTGACMLVKRVVWDALDGLDESLAVAFNDIDLCMRAGTLGYQTLWTPFAELIHHESHSRGTEDSPEKVARFRGEQMRMLRRWKGALRDDPFYSPNLTLEKEDFSLSWAPQLIRLATSRDRVEQLHPAASGDNPADLRCSFDSSTSLMPGMQ